MSRRPFLWFAVLALITAACTSGDDRPSLSDEFSTFPPDPTTTAAPPPPTAAPTTTATTAEPSPTERTPTVVGRLVVIDEAGNVVTMDPDGSNPILIADATEEGAAYFQPLWAPGSEQLAWSEAGAAGFALTTSDASGSNRTAAPMSSPPFYFYWAPDARHVAALHNGVNGIELKLVQVGEPEATFLGSGAPFYISWNPGTGNMAAHIGGDRLATIDTNGRTRELGPTAAGYQAPQWLPTGIVHLDGTNLQLLDEEGRTRTLLTVPGPVSFVANVQGTRLAIQSFGEDQPSLTVGLQVVPEIRSNAVIVVDLATGETSTASDEFAVAFFWSPNGEKLLILGVGKEAGQVDALIWESDETRHIATFAPARSFTRDVLPFFQQYAQSYQMWSPDSTAFAFARRVNDADEIWVQPIDDSPAYRVTAGTWVSWSN